MIAHDVFRWLGSKSWRGNAWVSELLQEVNDESFVRSLLAVEGGQLGRNGIPAVTGIGREKGRGLTVRSRSQWKHRDTLGRALRCGRVRSSSLQAIHLRALETEIAQHVIERTILHHDEH